MAAVLLMVIGAIAGVLGSWLIAKWQNRRADIQSSSLEGMLRTLPHQIIEALKAGAHTVSVTSNRLTQLEGRWPSHISFADVDNDGTQELLVQYPSGAHGNALQVFGWRENEYVELARIGVGVPVPFEFADFDGDGMTEVLGKESDWSTGLPYSLVPRYSFRLRWQDGSFREVWRANDYTVAELSTLKRKVGATPFNSILGGMGKFFRSIWKRGRGRTKT
jgi:hypothetical protein